jgi:hypothetical protein
MLHAPSREAAAVRRPAADGGKTTVAGQGLRVSLAHTVRGDLPVSL